MEKALGDMNLLEVLVIIISNGPLDLVRIDFLSWNLIPKDCPLSLSLENISHAMHKCYVP